MLKERLTTPVLLIAFNRADLTQAVFNEIRKVKPLKLFVSVDAPRPDMPDDIIKCQKVRDLTGQIDWDCEVYKNFADKNMGCDNAVFSAINWFFENAEEGIILEDDCMPSESFFFYCQNLLEHYREDNRIMHISGVNFQRGKRRGDGSYYFSKLPDCWGGWATWKRAWKCFDEEIGTFTKFKEQNQIINLFENLLVRKEWLYFFNRFHNKGTFAWDFQWAYSVLCQNGLCISPNVNLISNVGFGQGAMHTVDHEHDLANMQKYELSEIIHPTFMIPDKKADYETLIQHYAMGYKGLLYLIKRRFRKRKNLLIQKILKK